MKNKLIKSYARIELIKLQDQTEVEFKINKSTLNLCDTDNCFYGQTFGHSLSEEAIRFKKSLDLVSYEDRHTTTCLEYVLYKLWIKGKKEQCYRILETFCTFVDEQETNSDNLFEG